MLEAVDRRDYVTVRELGHGAYSTVTLARHRSSGALVAIKTLTCDADDISTSDFLKEISILGTCSHPCVVRLLGFIPGDAAGPPAYVTEYLERGSLADLLEDCLIGAPGAALSATQRSIVAAGVALALEYLHGRAIAGGAIAHRDVKSGNVLLDSALRPKLADFGFAKVLTGEFNTPRRGSPHWTAPEVLAGERYGVKADVFSYGMLLYELAVGVPPFVGVLTAAELYEAVVVRRERPLLPPPEAPVYALIRRCWMHDPALRPSFREIVDCLLTDEFLFAGTDLEEYFGYMSDVVAQAAHGAERS